MKAEGPRLRLLVRVPLETLRNVDYPKRDAEYVDLARADGSLRAAAQTWISGNIEMSEDGGRLDPRIRAARVSWAGDPSFGSYESALAHVLGPRLPDDAKVYWTQGLLDVLLEYDVRSDRSAFAIRPALALLGTHVTTDLQVVLPGGAVRRFEYTGDPGRFALDPPWHEAAWRFLTSGLRHVPGRPDHLLILLCLVVPFRRGTEAAMLVAGFAASCSLMLIASAFGLASDGLWVPPFAETLVAAAIVYVSLENIVGNVGSGRRLIAATGGGLAVGAVSSFALIPTLPFAGAHVPPAVLSFALGQMLGQFLSVAALLAMLEVVFRAGVPERAGAIVLSALTTHEAWHWMLERGGRLRQFAWPALDAARLAAIVRGLMVVVALTGLVWLVLAVRARRHTPRTRSSPR